MKIPDKQPEFEFQGRQVTAQVYDPTEGMSREDFGKAAVRFLKTGVSGVLEKAPGETTIIEGLVVRRVRQKRFPAAGSERIELKHEIGEPSFFEETMARKNGNKIEEGGSLKSDLN